MAFNPYAQYCDVCGRQLGSLDPVPSQGNSTCRYCMTEGTPMSNLSVICLPVEKIVQQAEELEYVFDAGTYIEEDQYRGGYHGCALGFLIMREELEDTPNDKYYVYDALEEMGYDRSELRAFEAGFEGWYFEEYVEFGYEKAFEHGEELRKAVANEMWEEPYEVDEEEYDEDFEECDEEEGN